MNTEKILTLHAELTRPQMGERVADLGKHGLSDIAVCVFRQGVDNLFDDPSLARQTAGSVNTTYGSLREMCWDWSEMVSARDVDDAAKMTDIIARYDPALIYKIFLLGINSIGLNRYQIDRVGHELRWSDDAVIEKMYDVVSIIEWGSIRREEGYPDSILD